MGYVQVLGLDMILFGISLFVFSRLGNFFSIAHHLMRGLEVILPPNEQTLKSVEAKLEEQNSGNGSKGGARRRSRNRRALRSADSVNIEPAIIAITPSYPFLAVLPHFGELETLLSAFLLCLFTFVGSNLLDFMFLIGRQEATSLFLAVMAAVSVVLMFLQTWHSSGSERSFCFVVGFFSFFFTLFLLAGVNPEVLDFEVLRGVNSVRNNLVKIADLLSEANVTSTSTTSTFFKAPSPVASMWLFAFGQATLASFAAVAITLPAFRFSRFHVDLVAPAKFGRGNNNNNSSLETEVKSTGSTMPITSDLLDAATNAIHNPSDEANTKMDQGIEASKAAGAATAGREEKEKSTTVETSSADEYNARSSSFLTRLALQANFFAPLLVVMLWVPALSSDLVSKDRLVYCDANALARDCVQQLNSTEAAAAAVDAEASFNFIPQEYLLTGSGFATVRLYVVLATTLLRLVVARPILRRYLNSGFSVARRMGQQGSAGFTVDSVKTVLEVTATHTCRVAIQMLSPILLWTCLILLLTRWGGYEFGVSTETAAWVRSLLGTEGMVKDQPSIMSKTLARLSEGVMPVGAVLEEFSNVRVITPVFLRMSLSFMLWFTHVVWFAVSGLGYWYYSTQDFEMIVANAYRMDGAKASKGGMVPVRTVKKRTQKKKKQDKKTN